MTPVLLLPAYHTWKLVPDLWQTNHTASIYSPSHTCHNMSPSIHSSYTLLLLLLSLSCCAAVRADEHSRVFVDIRMSVTVVSSAGRDNPTLYLCQSLSCWQETMLVSGVLSYCFVVSTHAWITTHNTITKRLVDGRTDRPTERHYLSRTMRRLMKRKFSYIVVVAQYQTVFCWVASTQHNTKQNKSQSIVTCVLLLFTDIHFTELHCSLLCLSLCPIICRDSFMTVQSAVQYCLLFVCVKTVFPMLMRG